MAARIVLDLWWCGNEGMPEPREWGGWRDRMEGGIECFSWAQRRLYLADNSYSWMRYCAMANTRDGGNKQQLQKRQMTQHFTQNYSRYTWPVSTEWLWKSNRVIQYSMCALTAWKTWLCLRLVYKNNSKKLNTYVVGNHIMHVIPCELLYWFYSFICCICPNELH